MTFFKRKQHFFRRYDFILLIFVTIIIIILLRLINIYFDEKLNVLANKQSNKKITLVTDRGKIIDRNNYILADNIAEININLDPQNIPMAGFNDVTSIWQLSPKYQNIKDTILTQQIKDVNKLADDNISSFNVIKYLSHLTNNDYDEVYDKFVRYKKNCENNNRCKRWYYLAKKEDITGKVINAIKNIKKQKFLLCKKYNPHQNELIKLIVPKKQTIKCYKTAIKGIYLENVVRRFYPYSPSTTNLIGAINHNKVGVFGIESTYHNYLRGSSTKTYFIKKRGNKSNYYKTNITTTHEPNNLYLTIDKNLQFYLFDAIQNAVNKNKAKSGSGIIINPSGEILAMASFPTNDINNGISKNYDYYLPRAISDNLEIASTMKPLLLALLVNNNKIHLAEVINFTKQETKNATKHYDFLTIEEILTKSYNPGINKITQRLSTEEIYNYLQDLGFGSAINIMPNIENSGVLKHFNEWHTIDKQSISYGYGPMNATLAQLAKAYLIFINKGKINNLKIIKNTKNIAKQVVSAETIEKMIPALEKVVNLGTAKYAKLNDMQVAGKTGSARLIINNKYQKNRTNAFFVGFAPSIDAQYLIAIVINDPKSTISRDGGHVAAPVFKQVMEQILYR